MVNAASSTATFTLEEYLRQRKWPLLGKMNDDKMREHEYAAAADLVSHPLTYPLAMSIFARFLLSSSSRAANTVEGTSSSSSSLPRDMNTLHSGSNMHIYCIGARAEATLPLPFWKEFLIATTHYNSTSTSDVNVTVNWNINFIGPEVRTSPNRTISIPLNDAAKLLEEPESTECSFLKLSFQSGYYNLHNEAQAKAELGENCNIGFVLFNPGLGHPHLKSGWCDTIDSIVGSRLPLFLTAHSDVDHGRDLDVIQESFARVGRPILNAHDFEYQPCPFASRMSTPDPFDDGREVRANAHYLYIPGTCNDV